jgi:hypothetical protein
MKKARRSPGVTRFKLASVGFHSLNQIIAKPCRGKLRLAKPDLAKPCHALPCRALACHAVPCVATHSLAASKNFSFAVRKDNEPCEALSEAMTSS